MFKKSTHRGRRGKRCSPLVRSVTRRLGLEAMERRLMLSGTSLDLTAASLSAVPFAQFTLEQTHQPAVIRMVAEGGFIQFGSGDAAFINASFNGNLALSGTGITHGYVLQELVDRNLRDVLVAASTSSGSFELGTFNNFPPVTFVQDWNLRPELSLNQPHTENATTVAGDEGGVIPIASFLAQVGMGAQIQTTHQSPKPLVQDTAASTQQLRQMAASTSSDTDGVAGEWARATVFELAGGEPQRGDRSAEERTAPANEPRPHVQIPVSAVRRNMSSLVASAAEPVGNRTATGQDRTSETTSHGDVASIWGDRWSEELPARATLSAEVEQAGGETRPGKSVLTEASLASASHAAAFEQLAEMEATSGHWLTSYSRPALTAAPLLLVLALERVAVRNSRRANKQAAAPIPLPRRPQDLGGDPRT